MVSSSSIGLIVPTLILIAALIDDLRTQKIHNWLVLSAALVAVVSSYFLFGTSGLKEGLAGMAIACAIILPLVITGMLGAGDMKLMMAFGLATNIAAVVWVVVYSFVWGALLGLVQAFSKGEGLSLLKNTVVVASQAKEMRKELHKIPYSVALFFGWLTYVSVTRYGWSLI